MKSEKSIWYVNVSGKAKGPISDAQIHSLMSAGKIRGHDLIFCEGEKEWKKASDWPEFNVHFSIDLEKDFVSAGPPPPPVEEKPIDESWILLIRDEGEREVKFKQRGPYSSDEIRRLLAADKIKITDHVWKKGQAKWRPLAEIAEFHIRRVQETPEMKKELISVEVMPRLQVVELPMQDEVTPVPFQMRTPPPAPKEEPRFDLQVEEAVKIFSPEEDTQGDTPVEDTDPEISMVVPPPQKIEVKPLQAKPKPLPTPIKKVPVPEIEDYVPVVKESIWSRVAPLMYLFMFAIVGAGIWATVKTRSPFPAAESVTAQVAPSAPEVASGNEAIKNNLDSTKLSNGEPIAAAIEEPEEIQPEPVVAAPSPKAVITKKKYEPLPPKKTVLNSSIEDDTKAPTSAPKQTNLKILNQTAQLEIVGPFKKGELIKIRFEGKLGQILDLPAVTQKVEVRATRDYIHKLSLSDLRIPKGIYRTYFQWESAKMMRTLTYGGDLENLNSVLSGQKKRMVFEQQAERKRLIRVTKDLTGLMSKFESEPGDLGLSKKLQKDLEEKVPSEVRVTKTNRFELIYASYWERLAAQWDRALTQVKDPSSRGPASMAEVVKIKKALSQIEIDVKNESVWSAQN